MCARSVCTRTCVCVYLYMCEYVPVIDECVEFNDAIGQLVACLVELNCVLNEIYITVADSN